MTLIGAIALAVQAANPTPAAVPLPASRRASPTQALGERLARSGSIMALLPLVARRDTDALIADHPELSTAQRQRLRTIAATTLDAGMARIATAFGAAYARRFTTAELRTLVAQAEAPAQRRLRAAQPAIMAEALATLGQLDFKADTLAAFCRDTGELCRR